MDSSKPDVHSANDWEHADVGGDDRKDKFLRLMGAKKKEHKGKIVIGEETNVHQHTRTEDEFKEVDESLEQGFNQGLEHSCAGSAHEGVGYPEKTENKSSEDKKEDEHEDPLDVKSANKWERANLGDTGRKNKFLRLMGASKKEHSGKFVIGEGTSERNIRSEKHLESDLEKQYNQGLGLRLSGAVRKHTGLGFQEEQPKLKSADESEKLGPEEKTDTECKKENQSQRDRENRDHHRNDDMSFGEERGGSYNKERNDGGGYRDRDHDRRRDNRDRNFDRRDERGGYRDRSFDRRRDNRDRRDDRREGKDWNYDRGRDNDYGKHGVQEGTDHQPPQTYSHSQNESLGQNTGSYNHPPVAPDGYSQPPEQMSYKHTYSGYIQPAGYQATGNQPTGYLATLNKPDGYQVAFSQPTGYLGDGQYAVGVNQGSYLPAEVLNQPPPPPPPDNNAQTVGNKLSTNWQNTNFTTQTQGQNFQNLQSPSVPPRQGSSYQMPQQQAFVPPQPNTQSSQHASAAYFQKPTMTFVKSNDS